MNLLKKFVRNDNADLEEDYDDSDIYIMPEDIKMEMDSDIATDVSAMDSPARKESEIRPASPDKVEVKLLQPKTHTEGTKIADKLKEGCIVILDISNLSKDKAHRLVDFLAGVAYVLGGEMIMTNKSTIVVSPAGVDISGFAPDETPEPASPAAPEVPAAEEFETYEEEIFVDGQA
ncbi:MAG: cell division protein SepF [Clostridia bacterium]|nr:cell division protein SepF [Clostridia bacterium]